MSEWMSATPQIPTDTTVEYEPDGETAEKIQDLCNYGEHLLNVAERQSLARKVD